MHRQMSAPPKLAVEGRILGRFNMEGVSGLQGGSSTGDGEGEEEE